MKEEKIIEIIKPHSLRGRPGDWNHARRVVKWVKILGEGRDDLDLLVLAGYIHDIGWRDLIKGEAITFDQLLQFEPQANKNSEPYIREILAELNLRNEDIEKIHLKEKYKSSEWMKMYEVWKDVLEKRTETNKAKELFPTLLEKLKNQILKLNTKN